MGTITFGLIGDDEEDGKSEVVFILTFSAIMFLQLVNVPDLYSTYDEGQILDRQNHRCIRRGQEGEKPPSRSCSR
jgi:hypothetical protein